MITKTPLGPKPLDEAQVLARLERFAREKETALSRAPEGTLIVSAPRRGSSTPEYYHRLGEQKLYLPQGGGELVDPDFLPDDLVRELWKSIEYESLDFSPNYPEYYTADNVRVRSLAERSIGTRLFERDRLYLYEFPHKLADGGIVYPDFTCLNLQTRNLLLWEHLGRLDDQKYVENNLRKLARYRASGYQLGVNLIVTHEVGGNPLSIREIDALIDTHLT